MPDFTTSQLSPDGNPVQKNAGFTSDIRNNTLVVVVTKAHGLRNVLRMDKQSPFITIRIQDQEESTKVIPRGGQTPTFNDELWFNLDGIEERMLYINAYHQRKHEAKLICSGEVDFTTALKRSTKEGYDGWFNLYWEGREAGRIYLEMTYYPKKGEVPIGTESVGRMHMSKSTNKLSLNDSTTSFNNSLADKSRMLRKSDADNIPELGELKIDNSTVGGLGKINSKFSRFEKKFNNSLRSPSASPQSSNHSSPHTPSKGDLDLFNESKIKNSHISEDINEHTGGNWLSFIDTTFKLPSILNNITFNSNNTNGGSSSAKKDINSEFDTKVKLKMELPDLIQERPKHMFISDDENDENETETIHIPLKVRGLGRSSQYKSSIESRQEQIYNEKGMKRNDIRYDDDDSDSDVEYTLGQAVDFKSSTRSRNSPNSSSRNSPKKTAQEEEEMRKSYQGRSLPPVKTPQLPDLSDFSDVDADIEDEAPPPPPKHDFSIFETNSASNKNEENYILDISTSQLSTTQLSKTAPKMKSLMDKNEDNSDKVLSWYERRKLERRKVK